MPTARPRRTPLPREGDFPPMKPIDMRALHVTNGSAHAFTNFRDVGRDLTLMAIARTFHRMSPSQRRVFLRDVGSFTKGFPLKDPVTKRIVFYYNPKKRSYRIMGKRYDENGAELERKK